jgi:hypothetical protein
MVLFSVLLIFVFVSKVLCFALLKRVRNIRQHDSQLIINSLFYIGICRKTILERLRESPVSIQFNKNIFLLTLTFL